MSDTTRKGTEAGTSTTEKGKAKKPASNRAPSLQLQRVVDTQSEPIAVFKTQKEGVAWLTENRETEVADMEKRGVKPDAVRYQFARLLGKPKALNVEVKVKLK